MDHAKVAGEVVEAVGGASNISAAAHCATRLRLVIADESKINQQALDDNEDLKGTFAAGGMFQIIVGPGDVDQVYAHMVSSAAFASLPVLVGFSAAKRFGGNVYLGAAIGAAMVSSDLLNAWNTGAALAGEQTVSYWHIFGMDVAKIGYQAQVIPTLAVTYVMCLIEKNLHKVLKGTADFLLTPLITMLVTGFLAFTIIGPVTRVAAEYLTWGINWTYSTLGVFGGLLFGLVYSPIVVTGLHQSFPAIEIPLLPVNGGVGDFIFPVASMANVAQGAAALAIFFKTRDAKLKGLAGAGGASAVFGITEPAIFGVNLRLRWPFFCAMAAAAIGSAGVALLNVRGQALGAAGFVGFVSIMPKSIPAYLALEVLVFVLSFGFTFAYAMTRGKADMEGRAPAKKEAVVAAAVAAPAGGAAPAAAPAPVPSFSDEAKADLSVSSPLAGTVVPLEQVKDESFAKGMLGPGIGIEPADGLVVAPFDGTVTVAFPTGHAYGLKSASGVQVLIHVGMDTVKLDGKGFTPRVAKGDVVRRGDVLAEVDLDVIREAGYETITPVVVTNKKKLGAVTPVASGDIQRGDALLDVAPKEA